MKGPNELVFVVENYKGLAEHNMLFTKDEFLAHLKDLHLEDMVEDIEVLMDHSISCFQWRSLYGSSTTIDFRCCRDNEDLCAFLGGKYNDSPDKMEQRGLLSFGRYGAFRWDVLSSSFSPRAVLLFNELQKKDPRLSAYYLKLFPNQISLDDVIRTCRHESEISSNHNFRGIKQQENISFVR